MSDAILDAKVKISIDNSTIDKSIKDASKKLEAGLAKADAKLSKQLTKQIDRDLGKLGRNFERGADKLSKVLERGLKFGLGAGATAIYAFLKSGTPEALKFSASLDKVKVAWARVGGILATKINFGGKNINQWVDVLADKLSNLDISQIQKIVTAFKVMAGVWAAIKIGQGIGAVVGMINQALQLYQNVSKLRGIGTPGNASNSVQGTSYIPIVNNPSGKKLEALLAAMPPMLRKMYPALTEESKSRILKADLSKTQDLDFTKVGRFESMAPRFGKYYNQMSDLRSGGINRGLSVAAVGASAISSINNIRAGESAWVAAGKTAGVAVGAFIAGPIGAAIGAVVTEGVDAITTGIADWWNKAPPLEPLQNMDRNKDMFTSNQYKRGASDPIRQLERSYIGQVAPYEERLKLVPQASLNIDDMNSRIEKLKATIPKGADISQYATIDAEVKALEDLIDANKKFMWETEKFSDEIIKTKIEIAEKYKKDMQSISDGIRDSKVSLAEAMTEFDTDAANRTNTYLANKDKILNPTEKLPLTGTISMGQSADSIPQIISQGLMDMKNADVEEKNLIEQRKLEVAELTKEYINGLWEDSKARSKLEEDFNKQQNDYQKQTLEVQKEQATSLKNVDKNTGGGGNSTVTSMRKI